MVCLFLRKSFHFFLLISCVGCHSNTVSKAHLTYKTEPIEDQQVPITPTIYSPKNCLYKVSFPIQPEIIDGRALNSKNMHDETASVLIPSDNNCYLRAEFIIMDRIILNEKSKIKILKSFSFA